MRLIITFLIFIGLSYANFAQEYIYTTRDNNYLRAGAGPYFDLVEVLAGGVKLKKMGEEENWLKVSTEKGKLGYISKNSISTKQTKKDYSSKFANMWTKSKVSQTGLAGAIKGLTGKSEKTKAGDPEKLMKYLDNDITTSEMISFVTEIKKEKSKNIGEFDLSDLNEDIPEYDPTYEEQQVGFGIASRLVNDGVYDNKSLSKYVNLIARSLVNNSKFYDWEFHVIVLDKKVVDGFAVPGGYLFITLGAIKSCNDESELAAIIGHEMGHIIRKHGLQEMTQRTGHIKMDEAFSELDDETGGWDEETSKVESDMDDIIASSYEHVVHDRLLSYEIEADQVSAILLAEAGYDPFAITRIQSRLAAQHQKTKDIFDNNYLAPNDLKERCKLSTEFVDDNFTKKSPGSKCVDRFIRMKSKF